MFLRKHNEFRNTDAVNFCMIGRALLGWETPANQGQRAVIEELTKVKAPKKRKKSQAA